MQKYFTYILLVLFINHANQSNAQLVETNLPILKITTTTGILKEPKVPGTIEIYNQTNKLNAVTDTPTAKYAIGVEYRGSSSYDLSPKKAYGFETRTDKGENLNISLLGLPADNDWVIIAPYSDKSLLRDHLTYAMARAMNRYASRTRFVELIVNGEYQGVCFLGEKIKQGKDRVNIAKLKDTDLTGDDLTGGYILKIDKTTGSPSRGWNSDYFSSINKVYFQIDYPKLENLKEPQFNYIKNFVNDFEKRLLSTDFKDLEKGYSKVIDIDSFIDFFIINELTRNVDGYRLSTFFHKDKDSKGGKLVMGPAWDFNLAFGNADYCDGWKHTGWAYKFNEVCPSDGAGGVPIWWSQLLKDNNFQIKLKTRWVDLRKNALSNNKIEAHIDSVTILLKDAQQRNFQKWNIMGRYVWPNYHYQGNYNEEITWTKTWIKNRLDWLDNSDLLNPNVLAEESPQRDMEKPLFFPNPMTSKSEIHLYLPERQFVRASILDQFGKSVKIIAQQMLEKGDYTFDVERNNLPAGLYFFNLEKNSKTAYYQKIILN